MKHKYIHYIIFNFRHIFVRSTSKYFRSVVVYFDLCAHLMLHYRSIWSILKLIYLKKSNWFFNIFWSIFSFICVLLLVIFFSFVGSFLVYFLSILRFTIAKFSKLNNLHASCKCCTTIKECLKIAHFSSGFTYD